MIRSPALLLLLVACSDAGLTKYNSLPEAQILSPVVGESLREGTVLLLRGAASDPNDAARELSARWFVDDNPVCEPITPNSDGTVECGSIVPGATFRVDLEVLDPEGAGAVASVSVGVIDDLPPSAEITLPTGTETLYADEPVALEGTVSDPEDDPATLAVRWVSSLDGELAATATVDSDGTVHGYGTLTAGTHALQLIVTDSVGQEASDDVLVTVEGDRPTPPTLTVVSPVDTSVTNEGLDISFIAQVSDPEDAPEDISLSWVSDLDGVLSTGTADTAGWYSFALADLTIGEHLLTVTATDPAGASTTELVTFRVNGLPGAPAVSISPASPLTLDDLIASLDADAVDPEGDPLSYTWAWSVDGTPSSASTSETLPASATTRGETWSVAVFASDPLGDGPAATAAVTIGNSAPSAADLDVTPHFPFAHETLTCTPSGWADDDGDADQTTFAWTVNGAAAGTGPTLAGVFATGDLVTCTATPFDGTDTGAPLSDSVVIQNTPPAVTGIVLSPSAPDTNDTITSTVTTYDVEGDSVTLAYAWTVNGVAVGTGTSLDGSLFSKHDVVELTVTPSDAISAGSPVSASVTVVNSPPTAPMIGFDPTDPEEGDALLCEVTTASTDLDGDTITYTMSWTVDGVAYPAGGDTGPSAVAWADDEASADDTDEGEIFTCTVTPYDGEDTGDTADVSVEIDSPVTLVFVSSDGLNGGFGALTNADAHCQDAADAAGLGGTWIAWISDTGESASSRIPAGPYVRLDGVTVANSLSDLTDGGLNAPINIDENGRTYSSWVLTGTNTSGSASYSGSTVNGLCANWTNGCGVCYGNHYYMTIGVASESDRDWTDTGWLFCSSSVPLYCFED